MRVTTTEPTPAACSRHESLPAEAWTDPQDKREAAAAIAVCRSRCSGIEACLAGAVQRGDWGVWGGHFLRGGLIRVKFRRSGLLGAPDTQAADETTPGALTADNQTTA